MVTRRVCRGAEVHCRGEDPEVDLHGRRLPDPLLVLAMCLHGPGPQRDGCSSEEVGEGVALLFACAVGFLNWRRERRDQQRERLWQDLGPDRGHD